MLDRDVSIVALAPRQVREAADVLAQSHAEYPSFRHLFPDPARRGRALTAFFRGVVRDAVRFGASHGALRADETLIGAAIWLPPGAYPWSSLRKLRVTPALTRVALAAPRSMSDFIRTGANTERVHPTTAHWYLEILGVRPEAQGERVGTRLTASGLARAERERLPCYLETAREENIDFYARFGFDVVADALPLVPGGPTHWAMWRAATGSSSAERPDMTIRSPRVT